jgi:hypothetical protein
MDPTVRVKYQELLWFWWEHRYSGIYHSYQYHNGIHKHIYIYIMYIYISCIYIYISCIYMYIYHVYINKDQNPYQFQYLS